MQYIKSIQNARTVNELFEIVKKVVLNFSGYSRSGIKLIAADLGFEDNFIGGFYKHYENTITLNTAPMRIIHDSNPKILNYYIFHILLHEYIHALGVFNEWRTRKLAYIISHHYFGDKHTLTQLAENMSQFFPKILAKERTTRIYNIEESFFDDFDKQLYKIINELFNLIDLF